MKRYNATYRDKENHTTCLQVDTANYVEPGEYYTTEQLGYIDIEDFFVQYIGFSFNAASDHDKIRIMREERKHNGVYIQVQVENQGFINQAQNYIDNNGVTQDKAYCIIQYNQFWIIELKDKLGYIVEIEDRVTSSKQFQECIIAIDNYHSKGKPPVKDPDTSTDKYLVAYMLKKPGEITAEDKDYYQPFIEQEIIMVPLEDGTQQETFGRTTKELAFEFYNQLCERPDIYTANVCKIIASTDYF